MNFLFVTRQMAVMDNTQVGGGRSTLLIEALSRLGHVDVISFRKEPIESSLPNCDVLFCGETPKRVLTHKDAILLNFKLFLLPWNPYGYYVIDTEQEKIVSRYYGAKHYDFVVCHFLGDAIPCGLMRYADQLIIDVDDNLVSAVKRDLANNHCRRLSTRIKNRWRTLMVGKMQNHLLKRVQLSFYSNPNDPPCHKSVFLQNVPLLSGPCPNITDMTPVRVLFVGNIDFFPNKQGIRHFAESIFPLIKERIPTAELHIVGLCKDLDFRSLLCSIDGVSVFGFVDDLQKEYRNCRAVIVPLYHGAGTSIKFIEGVMMNRPVVSTPMGARGFNSFFQAIHHYLLANSDLEFANHVVSVLLDTGKASIMARKAYEIGKVHFSRDSFYEVVKKSIDAITTPDLQIVQ